MVLAALPQAAAAAVRRVPGSYATIQAAVDAAGAGDIIDVAPGRHCGARIDRPVTLLGHGRATIIGCADGPALSSGVRAGFQLPGADGASGASGTHIEGFVFDGRGISADNLEPLGVAIIATFASHVRVERNVILGTVQGITNTAGDSWLIVHNVIRDLTVFDCTGALCGGGDGIVIQIARDPTAVPGGPEAAGNRPKDNVVVGNVIEGDIPDGFEAFDMAGVFVFAADRTVVARNRLSLPDNPNADAEGIGVLVDNSCCGLPAIVPGRATRCHVQRRPRQPARRRDRRHRRREHAGPGAVRQRRHRAGRGHGRRGADAAPPPIRPRRPLPALYAPLGGRGRSTPCSRTRARWSASSWGRWPTGWVCRSPSGACAPRGGRDR